MSEVLKVFVSKGVSFENDWLMFLKDRIHFEDSVYKSLGNVPW